MLQQGLSTSCNMGKRCVPSSVWAALEDVRPVYVSTAKAEGEELPLTVKKSIPQALGLRVLGAVHPYAKRDCNQFNHRGCPKLYYGGGAVIFCTLPWPRASPSSRQSQVFSGTVITRSWDGRELSFTA